MKNEARIFKLLSDETRLRTLMLLARGELFVCQIMAVLGISQPLVSRNLALLAGAGLLEERREGKLVFYSLKKDLPPILKGIISILRAELRGDPVFAADMRALETCKDFLKRTGKCDMKTFLAFMERQRKKNRRRL
jgi:ArsR family transcriptional regulator